MNQKRRILVSCIICCIILAAVVGIGLMDSREDDGNYATDYGQLQLYIKYSSGTEKINIWESEEGCYYFFLPSDTEGRKVTFGNLQSDDSVIIGGTVYHKKDSLPEELVFQTPYEIQLCIGGIQLEKRQIVFMRSENLPAVFIDTASGTVDNIHSDKTVKEQARLAIMDEQGNAGYRGSIEYIKTRGNSTFVEFDKKSYQIRFYSKQSLLGMEKAKKWILLANAKDDSLIRNKLVYDFALEYTEVPSIHGEYVDLYINGDYAGNYYLCEKVEVSGNRLDITDLEEKNQAVNSQNVLENGIQYVSEDGKIRAIDGLNSPEDITGGYLLEKVVTGEFYEAASAFMTDSGQCYCVVSPENAGIEQVEYICQLFNEMETAIYQPDGVNPETGKHFSEYLDMDSWTSKYLMEEAFQDPDAPAASAYFYKDSDQVDPLIYSGPMWDYDRAAGGYGTSFYYIDDPKQIGYRGTYAQPLLQHEEIRQMVADKFEAWFLPYVETEVSGVIGDLQGGLAASAAMNRARWPQTEGYYSGWEENGEYLVSFLQQRAEYLKEIWLEGQQYHTVTFLDYYGNIYDRYEIKHGEYLTVVPEIASYVAVFNGWYSTSSGKALDERLPVLEDETYQSQWIEVSILLQNGLGSAGMDLEQVDISTLEMLVEEIKRQREGGDP